MASPKHFNTLYIDNKSFSAYIYSLCKLQFGKLFQEIHIYPTDNITMMFLIIFEGMYIIVRNVNSYISL